MTTHVEHDGVFGGVKVESASPVRWLVVVKVATRHDVNCDDHVMAQVFGKSWGGRRLRSWGHNDEGVHFLAVQGGTALHSDKAYTRFSHQLVLRNDGTRIRGEPDVDEADWHPPMVVGSMYCLDTHLPHQGLRDPRMGEASGLMTRKCVVAVDRDAPLGPGEAWPLLSPYLAHQLLDFPVNARPPRWRPNP